MEQVTAPDLDYLVEKWQRILRLQDWDVTANYAPSHTFGTRQSGEIKYDAFHRVATIRVLDPTDKRAWDVVHDLQPGATVEEIVIHELLHLYFGFMPTRPESDPDYERMEQAMNAIAGSYSRYFDEMGRDLGEPGVEESGGYACYGFLPKTV